MVIGFYIRNNFGNLVSVKVKNYGCFVIMIEVIGFREELKK